MNKIIQLIFVSKFLPLPIPLINCSANWNNTRAYLIHNVLIQQWNTCCLWHISIVIHKTNVNIGQIFFFKTKFLVHPQWIQSWTKAKDDYQIDIGKKWRNVKTSRIQFFGVQILMHLFSKSILTIEIIKKRTLLANSPPDEIL